MSIVFTFNRSTIHINKIEIFFFKSIIYIMLQWISFLLWFQATANKVNTVYFVMFERRVWPVTVGTNSDYQWLDSYSYSLCLCFCWYTLLMGVVLSLNIRCRACSIAAVTTTTGFTGTSATVASTSSLKYIYHSLLVVFSSDNSEVRLCTIWITDCV